MHRTKHGEAITLRGHILAGLNLRGCNLRGSRPARRIGPIIEYNFYSNLCGDFIFAATQSLRRLNLCGDEIFAVT